MVKDDKMAEDEGEEDDVDDNDDDVEAEAEVGESNCSVTVNTG